MIKGLIKHTADGEFYKLELDPRTLGTLIKALECAFDMSDFKTACDMCDVARALEKIQKGESNGTE